MHEKIGAANLRCTLIVGIVRLVQQLITATTDVNVKVSHIRNGRDEPAQRQISCLVTAKKKDLEMIHAHVVDDLQVYSRLHLAETHIRQLLVLLTRIDLLLIFPTV